MDHFWEAGESNERGNRLTPTETVLFITVHVAQTIQRRKVGWRWIVNWKEWWRKMPAVQGQIVYSILNSSDLGRQACLPQARSKVALQTLISSKQTERERERVKSMRVCVHVCAGEDLEMVDRTVFLTKLGSFEIFNSWLTDACFNSRRFPKLLSKSRSHVMTNWIGCRKRDFFSCCRTICLHFPRGNYKGLKTSVL